MSASLPDNLATINDALRWRPVGDPVMGGVSVSRVTELAQGVRFHGRLSLESGGGFASAEASLPAPLPDKATGLRVRFRGDGKRYRLRVKTAGLAPGEAYQIAFEAPAGRDASEVLHFERFVPTRRGRPAPDLPMLSPDRIDRIGLLIADRQTGSFRFDLLQLSVVE